MYAHCNILDDIDEHEEDGFEAVIGIIVLVRVILHVPIEIEDEDNNSDH